MADKPLWKRMVEASKELAKYIPKEVMQKAETVIAETVCIEEKEEADG